MKKKFTKSLIALFFFCVGVSHAHAEEITKKDHPQDQQVTAAKNINEGKDVEPGFLLPGLTPDEIRLLRKEVHERRRATSEFPSPTPKPATRAVTLDLSPGAKSQTIKLFEGNGAVLVFTDVTGEPWPVAGTNNFAGNLFESKIPIEGGATVTVSAKTTFGSGNMAVFLKDLPTPVVINLVVGDKELEFDQRVDMSVPRGPNAKDPIVEAQNEPSFDSALQEVLLGLPPGPGAKEVTVTHNGFGSSETKIWLFEGRMYIRSTMAIMSPGYRGIRHSHDGMTAYVMEPTPVIVATQNGEEHMLRIEL